MSGLAVVISSWVRAAGEDVVGDGAARLSRRQRREERQRLHDAQKKARAIDRANDKRSQGRDKQAKKNKDKQQKKGK